MPTIHQLIKKYGDFVPTSFVQYIVYIPRLNDLWSFLVMAISRTMIETFIVDLIGVGTFYWNNCCFYCLLCILDVTAFLLEILVAIVYTCSIVKVCDAASTLNYNGCRMS